MAEVDFDRELLTGSSRKTPILYKVAVGVLLIVVIALIIVLATRSSSSDNPSTDSSSLYESTLCLLEGATNFTVPWGMRTENRARLMDQYRALNIPFDDRSVIYFEGGHTQTQFYSDTELYFRQESNFLFVSGYQKAEALFLIRMNVTSGYAMLFVQRPTTQSATWNGIPETPEELMTQYEADEILYTDQLASVVNNIAPNTVYTLPNVNTSTSLINGSFSSANVNATVLNRLIATARAVKSTKELEMMAYATNISILAHLNVMQLARKGAFDYEYQLSAQFQEVCEACGGWSHQSYLPIVGSGPNSAVLHYNTNYEPIEPTDMILIDAGSEFYGYGTDITRTWPVSGKFSTKQANIYNLVLNVQEALIPLFRPGILMTNISTSARQLTAQGLLDVGLVRGNLTDLLANSIDRIFLPHGVTHFLGLDVHDPAPTNPSPYTLQPNMVLTVEPGIYFIPTLLTNAYNNPQQLPYLNVDVINSYANETGVGGYRLEDVVLVTATGPQLLSGHLPRNISDIEKLMASA